MREFNIDGLIGPTHHFGGLGVGNVASESNRNKIAHPRSAALEGLSKIRKLYELGVPQFYLPPPGRPNWDWMMALGFQSQDAKDWSRCAKQFPSLFSSSLSSSFMWMANAATCSSRVDTTDGIGRLVIANLAASLHRGQESPERHHQLRHLFQRLDTIEVIEALPSLVPLRDEGAANAMRCWNPSNHQGIYVFVFGETYQGITRSIASGETRVQRGVYPSRQTSLASQLIARSLRIPDSRSVFVQQHPQAIDAGVFHNDVIATSHEDFLLLHERAYLDQSTELDRISETFRKECGGELSIFVITEDELPLSEAVATYLFNSQIVTRSDGSWCMFCPIECMTSPAVTQVLQRIQSQEPRLGEIEFVSLRESMANGGGPACLRLRVYASDEEIEQIPLGARIQDESLFYLERLIASEYPDSVQLDDFLDLQLVNHCRRVSEAISQYWQSERP
ncbi:N-succinylarginine dihydrolase [Pirellula sp. SH-Sr6A]|uniref:N-succinylarginine dihydrolase n=1 Tax=Pirellula sp. SH-Sr6A TaxID=1632865 RepID=UPI00078D4D13|nr:N-succinylarginine dihydrolase [Pirellula sp. SH-Sr6A]AMV32107.1 N-succinylarginine dihydrolase [Pirellula sp. SH-Sr6A]